MTRRLPSRPLVVLLVAAAALSACTDDTAAPPTHESRTTESRTPESRTTTTTQPPETTSTTEVPRPTVAPEVAEPIGLDRLRRHACAVLGPRQQADLGFGPVAPVEVANGRLGSCVWTRSEPGPDHPPMYAYVLWIHPAEDRLAEAYGESEDRSEYSGSRNWPVFEPRTIRGLPAVLRTNTEVADSCEVIVGAGNGGSISMKGQVEIDDPQLCDRMVTAAELVVDSA